MSENPTVAANVEVSGQAVAGAGVAPAFQIGTHYKIECFDKHGKFKWVEEFDNIIPNVGLDNVLQEYLKGSGYTAAFFIGLTDGTPTVAATDTMASHAGWTEVTAYSQTDRQDLILGTVSGQQVDNTASKGVFTINADNTTIGGAFLVTDNTKGGASGVLYSVAAFNAADKQLDNGDTLNCTAIATAASV
jgi:hypothetical protein